MSNHIFKINNFDLLRLIAALQVAMHHAIEVLNTYPTGMLKTVVHYTYLFPGVPIFFFISGFLISKSYENNNKVSEYVQNRILRLYPGLFVVVALSFVLIAISGYMEKSDTEMFDWIVLYIAKTTFLQFYNPDFMRAYGDGVLNGSLWTITVELQFYVLIPILYAIFKLNSSTSNYKLIILIVVFLIINRVYAHVPVEYKDYIIYKLVRVSFLPWFYMFLIGVLAQRNFEILHKYLSGKFIYMLIIYSIISYGSLKMNLSLGNNINPFIFIVLALTIFSFAYSTTSLSRRILRGHDISYGTYIYHMPILNFIIYMNFNINPIIATLIAILIAILSWVFIERPSLKLKKHPLNPLNKA